MGTVTGHSNRSAFGQVPSLSCLRDSTSTACSSSYDDMSPLCRNPPDYAVIITRHWSENISMSFMFVPILFVGETVCGFCSGTTFGSHRFRSGTFWEG